MFSKKVQWHQPLMNSLHLHLGPCFLSMISISFSNHLLTPSRVLCSLLSVGICYSPFDRIIYEKQNVWRQKRDEMHKAWFLIWELYMEQRDWVLLPQNTVSGGDLLKSLCTVSSDILPPAPTPWPQSPWRALSLTSPVEERGFSEENWQWEC